MARRATSSHAAVATDNVGRVAGTDGTLRALTVLEALAPSSSGLSVTELGEQLGDSKALVHRALAALVSAGYVEQDAQNSQYRLTTRVIEVASRYHQANGFSQSTLRIIQHLADESGSTIEVCRVIAGLPRAVHVAAPANERSLGVVVFGIIGEIQTPYATGSGKVWLAEQEDEDVESYLRETRLEPLGTNTITDPDALRAEIALVRQQGYAMNRMEDNSGWIAVAVPIRDLSGGFVGSLSLVRPAYEVTDAVEAEMLEHARSGSDLLARHLPSWRPRIR
jgi:DNA-binding IclR family transcriptional regulator